MPLQLAIGCRPIEQTVDEPERTPPTPIFETVLLRLAKQAMDLINAELLRGRDENTVDLIKELVRYAAFVDGDLGLNVEEATAWQTVNIYEAFDFGGEDSEAIEANKETLKAALGISQ